MLEFFLLMSVNRYKQQVVVTGKRYDSGMQRVTVVVLTAKTMCQFYVIF